MHKFIFFCRNSQLRNFQQHIIYQQIRKSVQKLSNKVLILVYQTHRMFRMAHHTRGSAIAAFLTRNHRPITFSRSIHNVKLVGLHNQLFQPDPEMIRFDGLRLHGPTDKMVTHPGCIEPARAIASGATRYPNFVSTPSFVRRKIYFLPLLKLGPKL